MYSEAPFCLLTFKDDVAASGTEGGMVIGLPSDEEIAAAANTGVPERSDGPGANLPTYVSQAEDGSLQLRMHVKLVTISDKGAVGWGGVRSEEWEYACAAREGKA